MYLRGETADQFQHKLRGELTSQVALATVVSRGLVWGPSRSVFTAAVGLWPEVLGVVARGTRIPEGAMLTLG